MLTHSSLADAESVPINVDNGVLHVQRLLGQGREIPRSANALHYKRLL